MWTDDLDEHPAATDAQARLLHQQPDALVVLRCGPGGQIRVERKAPHTDGARYHRDSVEADD